MFDPVTLRVPDLATARTALAVVLNELDIQETRSTLSFSFWGTSLSRRPTTTIPSHGASISRSSPPPQPMSTASAEPAPVPLRLDVTNTDQVAEAARQAQDVDLLINNAGRVEPGELTGEAIVDVARREMEVNYFGPLRMLQRFADTLAQHGGAIVNVNSGAGLANAPILPTYSASKAALHSLTQASRALLAARGVAVFGVYAGPVDTDLAKGFDLDTTPPQDVANGILDGVEAGNEDIFPDPWAVAFAELFNSSPKDAERQAAAMTA